MTFVVGSASDVFGADFARSVDAELQKRFPSAPSAEEAYRSDTVEAIGWPQLQKRATSLLGANAAPELTKLEAYQAVFVPAGPATIEYVPIPQAADPLQVASLDALLGALQSFATAAKLPTDDVELMQLAAHYLEDDAAFDRDLDVQTYIQLLLSAKQAAARRQPLWIAT